MNPAVHLMLSHKKIKRNYKEKQSQTIEQFSCISQIFHFIYIFFSFRIEIKLKLKFFFPVIKSSKTWVVCVV